MKKNINQNSAANPPQADWFSIWSKKMGIYILVVHYAWSVYVLNFNCVVLNIRAFGRDHLSINTVLLPILFLFEQIQTKIVIILFFVQVAIGFSEILGVFIGMNEDGFGLGELTDL